MDRVSFLLLIFFSCHLCNDHDLPGYTAAKENIQSGSWVIPMDNTLQGDGGRFRLHAYGLVNALLWGDTTVKWAIKLRKQHNEVDFSARTSMLYPQSGPSSMRDFKAGPFIVVRSETTPKAQSLVTNYLARFSSKPSVYRLDEDKLIDIRMTILSKPKVAVFDSSKNFRIQVAVLLSAGFVEGDHFQVMSKEEALQISSKECFTMASEPHFHAASEAKKRAALQKGKGGGGGGGGGGGDPESFVGAMRQFVEGGGNFLAQCGGISTYEQCDNVRTGGKDDRSTPPVQNLCPSGFLFTKGGLNLAVKDLKSSGPTTSLVPDTPYAQFEGDWVTNGGSVAVMSLWSQQFDSLGPSTLNADNKAHWVLQANTNARPARDYGYYYAAHAKLAKFHGRTGGNIFYLAGHEYDSGKVNGRRLYMNAVLHGAYRPGCSLTIDVCQSCQIATNPCYKHTCDPTQNPPCVTTTNWEEKLCMVTSCDNTTMTVVRTPKCAESKDPCLKSVCTPQGTCTMESKCPEIADPCLKSVCTAQGACLTELKCPESTDPCKKSVCTPQGTCLTESKCPESTDPCKTSVCTAQGTCLTESKCPESTDPCKKSVCTAQGTCLTESKCPESTNPCFNSVCTPQGTCMMEAKCPESTDPCKKTVCTAQGTCLTEDTLPPNAPSDPCMKYVCDSLASPPGWTLQEIKDCRCKSADCDTCHECPPNGTTCVPKPCPYKPCFSSTFAPRTLSSFTLCCDYTFLCQSADLCKIGVCSNDTCDFAPKPCDDGNICTNDSCNSTTGECAYTPSNVCPGSDNCTTTFCDLSSQTCKSTPVNCDDGIPCTDDMCDLSSGCLHVEKNCSQQTMFENGTCLTWSCNANSGDCESLESPCLSFMVPDASISSRSVEAGIVAGVVLAALVGVGIAGGGTYAVVGAAAGGPGAGVTNNPLYKALQMGGENPLFKKY